MNKRQKISNEKQTNPYLTIYDVRDDVVMPGVMAEDELGRNLDTERRDESDDGTPSDVEVCGDVREDNKLNFEKCGVPVNEEELATIFDRRVVFNFEVNRCVEHDDDEGDVVGTVSYRSGFEEGISDDVMTTTMCEECPRMLTVGEVGKNCCLPYSKLHKFLCTRCNGECSRCMEPMGTARSVVFRSMECAFCHDAYMTCRSCAIVLVCDVCGDVACSECVDEGKADICGRLAAFHEFARDNEY